MTPDPKLMARAIYANVQMVWTLCLRLANEPRGRAIFEAMHRPVEVGELIYLDCAIVRSEYAHTAVGWLRGIDKDRNGSTYILECLDGVTRSWTNVAPRRVLLEEVNEYDLPKGTS